MRSNSLLVRIVGGFIGAACGMGPLLALDQAGRAQMISEREYVFLSLWISPGVPIAALAGGLAGAIWARSAWRLDGIDWWKAGAVAATAFGIGLLVAAVWAFSYRIDEDISIETRLVVMMVVMLGALPMVAVALMAALAWLTVMHLAAKAANSTT